MILAPNFDGESAVFKLLWNYSNSEMLNKNVQIKNCLLLGCYVFFSVLMSRATQCHIQEHSNKIRNISALKASSFTSVLSPLKKIFYLRVMVFSSLPTGVPTLVINLIGL